MSSPAPDVVMYGHRLRPGAAAHWQAAVVRMRASDLAGAVAEMQQLLDVQPGFVPAVLQLSIWLLAQDRYREARLLARQVALSRPASPELALQAIRLLRRFEDHERVQQVVQGVDWRQCPPDLLLTLAGELAPIALYGEARNALILAEAGLPAGDVRPLGLRATLQMIDGDSAAATASLQRVANSGSGDAARAMWLLSMQSGMAASRPAELARLEHALHAAKAGSADEVYLAYAIHNYLHASGDHGAAWTALERACKAKRMSLTYDPATQRDLFGALEALPRFDEVPLATGASQVTPVFVVGMHRSGTTLLERMLGGHPDVRDGGESYAVSAAVRHATDHYSPHVLDAELVGRLGRSHLDLTGIRYDLLEYTRWQARGRRFLTEKLPSNFLHLGVILAAMPEARVLHMRRDPMDTCFSNLRTLFSTAAPYSYDQSELADYFLGYQALMKHWHDMWPGRILDVEYQRLVEDPEGEAARIMAFCGMDPHDAVLHPSREGGAVATASLADVRSGIQKNRGGAWRPYAAQLEPLRAALSRAAGGACLN